MREIKFRAWDLKKNMYAYDVQNEYDTITGVRYWVGNEKTDKDPGGDCFGSYLNNHRFMVEQFIGASDVEGVEIYEGDLLRTNELRWIGEVVYHQGAFVLLDNRGGFSALPDWGECKVIGNIHENPELVKETHGT